MIELEKENKNPTKDIWETIYVIPLLSLLGVNLSPTINTYVKNAYLYKTEKK